jgi:hypothetical protein
MDYKAEDIWRLAVAAHKTGLAPQECKSADHCYYIMCAGHDVGLAPTVALRTLAIVKGRVSIGAEAMLALAIRGGVKVEWLQSDDKAASLCLTREGHKPYTSTFTVADAKQAGLGGQNWDKYRAAMLRARCISAGVRAYCPDVITGLYTPEEVASFSGADDPTEVRAIPGPTIAAPMLVETPQIEVRPTAGIADRAKWLDRVGVLRLVEDYCGIAAGWSDAEAADVQRIIARVAAKLDEPARTADFRPTAMWTSDEATQKAVYRITEAVVRKMTRERDDADAAAKTAELAAREADLPREPGDDRDEVP